MKLSARLFGCLLFFVVAKATGQVSALKGTWINPEMQAMVINDTSSSSNNNFLSTKKLSSSFQLQLYGDTLSFQNRYTSSATNFKKLYIDRYDFKIVRFEQHTLELKPVSKFSSDFFGGGESILLKRQEYTADTTIRFEKLVFSSGLCHGSCPKYEYELTNKKAFRLHIITAFANRSFMRDSTAQGCFIGEVPDSLYRKVIDALQTCYLRQLIVEPALCCDAPLKKLSIQFNGQKKTIETMFPPVIMTKLFAVLSQIYDAAPRKRTDTPFDLELKNHK
ncbi:hypothetical protein [Spirosoma litoris]